MSGLERLAAALVIFLVDATDQCIDVLGSHPLQLFIQLAIETAVVRLLPFLRLSTYLPQIHCGLPS